MHAGAKDREREEKGAACEQGQVYKQDVSPRRFGHHCFEES